MAEARDIENYEKAYIDRKKDLALMRKNRRKVMSMYLGGIYLECLLKTVIIKKNKVCKSIAVYEKRKRVIYWYDDVNYEKLQTLKKPQKNDYKKLNKGFNPEHNLILALKQIDEFYENITEEGIKRLEMLNRPINNQSFTNLRYTYDEQVPDEVYRQWEENFLYFMSFFYKMRRNLVF